MSTAFVTGATGFVGSHLVRRLVRDGYAVHALCRPGSDPWRLRDVLPHVRMHTASLTDADQVSRAVRAARPRYVFHLGGATVVAGAARSESDLEEANLIGSRNLLEACESTGYRGLVTTGDAFEYAASDRPLPESAPCHPSSAHGAYSLAATLLAQALGRGRRRPIVALRLFSAYGPCDNPRRLVPRVIAGAAAGTPIQLSRPEIVRDWVYVEDLIGLYLEAAERAHTAAGAVFNAGSGRAASLGVVVETILRLTGSHAEPRWGTFAEPAHDRHPWVADMARTFGAFTWRPSTSLEQGLATTIAATRDAAAA